MLAKKTYKNQITIPKAIIRVFPSVEYFDVELRGEEIVLKPIVMKPSAESLENIRSKMAVLGITEKDVEEAVRWARRSTK
jgi:hypothetical protein